MEKSFNEMSVKEKTDYFNSFSIDERKEFLNALSEDERKKFISDIRKQAVIDFWTEERELIKNGQCTRDWTPDQIEAIMNFGVNGDEKLNGGKAFQMDEDGLRIVDSKGNTSYYAHHMLDVSTHPEYAGDWRNIQALACDERYNGAHDGNTKIPTEGYYDYTAGETKIFDKWQKANMNWINDSIAIVY